MKTCRLVFHFEQLMMSGKTTTKPTNGLGRLSSCEFVDRFSPSGKSPNQTFQKKPVTTNGFI